MSELRGSKAPIDLISYTGSSDPFCRACGAGIPPRRGEGTCEFCDPEGVKAHIETIRRTARVAELDIHAGEQ